MKRVQIAPSILSADFSRLGEEIRDVEKAGVEIIHIDVMDAHFVPNLTIGPPVIKSLRKVTNLPFDVHLMIEKPVEWVEAFRKAGADWITVHVEACQDVVKTLQKIQELGAKPGLSLRPGTSVAALEPYLDQIGLVLVMSVEPGFGGQSFQEVQLEKLKFLRPRFKGLLSIDGGISAQNARHCVEAGADILVAGTAVFGQNDRLKAVESLRG